MANDPAIYATCEKANAGCCQLPRPLINAPWKTKKKNIHLLIYNLALKLQKKKEKKNVVEDTEEKYYLEQSTLEMLGMLTLHFWAMEEIIW